MPTINVGGGITRIQDASDFSGTPSDGQILVFGSGVFAPTDRFPWTATNAPFSSLVLIKNNNGNAVIGIDGSGNPFMQDNSGANSISFRSIGVPQLLSANGGMDFDDSGVPQLRAGASNVFVRWDNLTTHAVIGPNVEVGGDLAIVGNASAANLSNTNTGDKPSVGSANDVQLANGSGGFSGLTGQASSTLSLLDSDGVTAHSVVISNGVVTSAS